MAPTLQTPAPKTEFIEAGLHENFGSPDAFGIRGPVPVRLMDKIAKAILVVAGADGRVTQREWNRFAALATRVGMPPQALQDLGEFDYLHANFDDYFDDETRPMAKVILFEATKVARADGYAENERAATRRAAELLGVEPETVTAIEGLVDVEESINEARIRLLRPNDGN